MIRYYGKLVSHVVNVVYNTSVGLRVSAVEREEKEMFNEVCSGEWRRKIQGQVVV